MSAQSRALELIRRSAGGTVGGLFRARVAIDRANLALQDDRVRLTFGDLDARVNRTASLLASLGVRRGDRVAVLSENRIEYVELQLACAVLGAILACQNWRLAPPELQHCLSLVEPAVVVVSPRHSPLLDRVECGRARRLTLGEEHETRLATADPAGRPIDAEPEDGLLILYTSGTTGLPKGAVLSHRAEIARYLLMGAEFSVPPGSTSVAWPPLYHMAATEPALAALLQGGKVIVVDGFDPIRLAQLVAEEEIGWLILMPGMIQPLIDELHRRGTRPRGVHLVGAMADLVPAHQIAEITRLLNAPYVNTFGATETGVAPCSSSLLPIGEAPTCLSKRQTSYCELRLVDAEDRDVPDGQPGECAIRGVTLFSGYWRADESNARDFRGGWFHMGDMFVRNPDGTLDFVDRVKYLIKSGGENIYPAEIERVLLGEPRVADAVVVRRQDVRWGEVPVAFVARKDDSLDEAALRARCRAQLAGYKQPAEIRFIALERLPRSATGKIQRHEIERWLAEE